jgi:ribonuclease HII
LDVRAEAVVKGDATVPCIGAASIIAKVTRDRELQAMDAQYPGYGFAAHKGYGTAAHAAALNQLGPCPAHRMSFAPVQRAHALHRAAP